MMNLLGPNGRESNEGAPGPSRKMAAEKLTAKMSNRLVLNKFKVSDGMNTQNLLRSENENTREGWCSLKSAQAVKV